MLNQNLSFGINQNLIKKSFLIEFVSANPTGPLHVGHCRGAILGDTLANLLKFQGHDVTKEYYVNDYGNQIISFSKSVYLRIREIKYKEPFPQDENLYPGDYITEIADSLVPVYNSELVDFCSHYDGGEYWELWNSNELDYDTPLDILRGNLYSLYNQIGHEILNELEEE